MKKLLSLMIALCLLCVSTAFAVRRTATGEPLVTDDFTLALDAGMPYELYTKRNGQALLVVYPYDDEQRSEITEFCFYWWGGPFTISADRLNNDMETAKKEAYEMYDGTNISVDSAEITFAVEGTLCGEPYISRDICTRISRGSDSATMIERQYFIGSKGYMLTMTADDPEKLDQMEDLISGCLTWN